MESALAEQHRAGAPHRAVELLAPFTVGELARRLGVAAATLRTWERAGILAPVRDPRTGHRSYRSADVRDAELAHLLRRGGRGRAAIAVVLRELRGAGNVAALAASALRWQQQLTASGRALLRAAGLLADYLEQLDKATRE